MGAAASQARLLYNHQVRQITVNSSALPEMDVMTSTVTFGLAFLCIAVYFVYCVEISSARRSYSQDIRSFIIDADEKRIQHILDVLYKSETYHVDTVRGYIQKAKELLEKMKIALLVIDFQHDFVYGSLPIGVGDAGEDPLVAVSEVNRLIKDSRFHTKIFTKDWHPKEHISFVLNAHLSDRELSSEFIDKKLAPFMQVDFVKPKCKQTLYPAHCIQYTQGAEIIKEINVPEGATIFNKGTNPLIDSYSAFVDATSNATGLSQLLHEKEIQAVIGCGLAYDICVRHTLSDAAKEGFYTMVARDASAALSKKGVCETDEAFEEKKVAVLSTEAAIEDILSKKRFPLQWFEKALNHLLERNNALVRI